MRKRQGFLLYADMWPALATLPPEELKLLIQGLFSVIGVCEKPKISNPVTAILFKAFGARLQSSLAHYDNVCEIRRQCGAKGGKAKAENLAKQEELANENELAEVPNGNDVANDRDIANARESDNLAIASTLALKNRIERNRKDSDIYTPPTPSTGECTHESDSLLTPEEKSRKQSAYTQDFEVVWAVYPRKVNKGNAFKAYQKAKKHGLPDTDKLIEFIRRRMQAPDWRDPKYIPHFATWLNARGWEDEPDETPEAIEDSLMPENQAFARLHEEISAEKVNPGGVPKTPPAMWRDEE